MEPPSMRELELETLLRERDTQVAELTDEVNQLRKYLTTQPVPSHSDSVSLPPALLAVLQAHIGDQAQAGAQASSSSTMTAALMQRARVLQDENDELYELLRVSETGKLKEEVQYLKRVVSKLERALKESHTAASSLTDELQKSKEILSQQKPIDSVREDSRSPPRNYSPANQRNANNIDLKPVPTGPRAHKKPRLSESQPSPARSNVSLPPSNSNSVSHGHSSRNSRREYSPRAEPRRTPVKDSRMDIDEDVKRGRPGPPEKDSRHRQRDRDRDRDRDRQREKDRPRERQRDRERPRDRERGHDRDSERHKDRDHDRPRRNGTQSGRSSGGGGGSSRKGPRGHALQDNGDRTLAERMGL